MGMVSQIKIFTGNAHPSLARTIGANLNLNADRASVSKFSNKETKVEIYDSVREDDVYILQSGCGDVNDNIMELLILINGCKTASAKRIVAVLPFFPYSKQSKKKSMRSSIPAKLVANMLKVAGADHIISIDLHASQMQGFFDMPVDNIYAASLICKYLHENFKNHRKEMVIVAKNAGAAKRATSVASDMCCDFALIHKEQHPNEELEEDQTKLTLVGSCKGKTAVIMDDIVDSASTFVKAANILKEGGAEQILIIATHGIFSGTCLQELHNSCVDKVVVTNSVPQKNNMEKSSKLSVIDIAPILSEAIRRIHNGESVSYLYKNVPL
eukprot:Nk52_evm99s485 gene=Nk52_evmTU99s485